MKKAILLLCMILLAVLILPATVSADVIYQPFDDFYFEHMTECDRVSRSYTASGPNGTVTLYTDPVSGTAEAECPNGTTLFVSYTYADADGVLWGCCDDWETNVTGWAPMAYLRLIYDGISFAEEYGDQFVEAQITPDFALIEGNKLYFWTYPGCSEPMELEVNADRLPECYQTYTDPDGNVWGLCGYFLGIKNQWINLSNPSADYETLFPNIAEETVPSETEMPDTEPLPEIKPAGSDLVLPVSCAVAAVVIVTGLLLVVLKKKKR